VPFVGKYSVRISGSRVGGEHSLSLHPLKHNGYAAASFPLNAKYDGLVGAYGFIEPVPREGSELFFTAKADGRALPESLAISRDKPAEYFAFQLNGCQRLEVWVRLKGFYEGTHAGWIEPLLIPIDFDLKKATDTLAKDAKEVPKASELNFLQRSLLLEQIARVRRDKKAKDLIGQARKAAQYRLNKAK
jgi:hypothetical protein